MVQGGRAVRFPAVSAGPVLSHWARVRAPLPTLSPENVGAAQQQLARRRKCVVVTRPRMQVEQGAACGEQGSSRGLSSRVSAFPTQAEPVSFPF